MFKTKCLILFLSVTPSTETIVFSKKLVMLLSLTIPAACTLVGIGCACYSTDARIAANYGNGYFRTTAVSSAQNPDDGKGIFEYDVPAGYTALSTGGLNQ